MKPTAQLRNALSVFATTPCRGLSPFSLGHSHSLSQMNLRAQTCLLILQTFQVAFLWLHDWLPLGRLNDVAAVRRLDSLPRLVKITLIQSVPFTLGLIFSLWHLGQPFPAWLRHWLLISYG